jgi:hypothetical protein
VGRHEAAAAGRHSDWRGDGDPAATCGVVGLGCLARGEGIWSWALSHIGGRAVL